MPKLSKEFETKEEARVFSSVVKGKIFTGSKSFLVVYEPRKKKEFSGFQTNGKYIGCKTSINPKTKLMNDNRY